MCNARHQWPDELLQKSPDERYSSAYGVKADLKECLDRFKESGFDQMVRGLLYNVLISLSWLVSRMSCFHWQNMISPPCSHSQKPCTVAMK